MKELVFPKDQELFQGIDEKGAVIPFSGPDTMAARYESSLEFYRSLNDTVHVSGSSEEELKRDLSSKLRQIQSSQWESLDQVVEDASQDPIGRFPKTSYDLYLYISKRDKSRRSVTMNHFFELDQALQLYDKDLAPSGPLGKLFNEVEKKARQLRELRTKRRKLLLELPVIALQILAAPKAPGRSCCPSPFSPSCCWGCLSRRSARSTTKTPSAGCCSTRWRSLPW